MIVFVNDTWITNYSAYFDTWKMLISFITSPTFGRFFFSPASVCR